jgi:DNA-binding winged helix-turn-helix (wHTH) protein
MELLIFLVSRRDQLVSRQDIVTLLWRSDLHVDTERNVNNIVRKIRSALSDDPEKPVFLETVVGKGYRFIGPLRVVHAQFQSSEAPAQLHSAKFVHDQISTQSQRAALAVLPLVPVGDAADDYGLSLGFADALVNRLGNLAGIDLWLDQAKAGSLRIDANIVSGTVDLGRLAGDRIVFAGGGLGRKLSVYRLPEADWSRRVTLDHTVAFSGAADLPVYVRVTQADGNQAWSSPIYLIS